MSQEIDVEVRLRLGLPEETHQQALGALLTHAERVGGTALEVTTVYVFEGSEDIPHHLISSIQFLEYGADMTSKPWLGKTWDVGLDISNKVGREKAVAEGAVFEDAQHTIDLNNILVYMRAVEAGNIRLTSFAKTAWNIFGAIINERFSQEGETVVLGWNNNIHKKFLAQAATSTNKEGVSELSDLYLANL